jgi:hypothetical protein
VAAEEAEIESGAPLEIPEVPPVPELAAPEELAHPEAAAPGEVAGSKPSAAANGPRRRAAREKPDS